MIPPGDEIRSSLRGALMLAQRDPGGMAQFNLTVDGFWNSFFAAVLAAPVYVILVAQRHDWGAASPIGVLLVEAVGYVLGWLALPLSALFLVRLFALGARYVPLVVAANWAGVIQAGVFLGAVLIARQFGGLGGSIVLLAATLGVLLYEWYVIRTALDTTGAVAAGFVAADWVVSLFVNAIVTALAGP
jgi:hypothetical protein